MNSLELKDKRYEISRSTVNGIKYVEFQCKLNEICSTQRKMKNSYIILLPNVERKYHLGFYVIIEKISVIMIECIKIIPSAVSHFFFTITTMQKLPIYAELTEMLPHNTLY
jgi:hypothetical protein